MNASSSSLRRFSTVSLSVPSLWQLNRSNIAVYGLVILGFLGIEVPLFLGGELRGGTPGAKRAMSYVWWGVGLTFAAYISASFGLLVVVPPDQAGTLSSGATALALVFGSFAGKSIAVRVYRTAMSPLAARAELERCAGSQFDPDVVAAFLKVLDMQEFMEPSSNLVT